MKTRFLLFLLGIPALLPAQEINKEGLDSLMDELEDRNVWMGAVVVARKGEIVYERGIGNRRIGPDDTLEFTTDTRSRIGSVTKTFTATMIMQLIEEGELEYSTSLGEFYPKVPNADSITVDHLLLHISGLPRWDASTFVDHVEKEPSREEMLGKIRRMEPNALPEEEQTYSNANYVLLGYIIEEVTGKSYGANLQERIAGPLGLERTTFGNYTGPGRDQALSYRKREEGWEEVTKAYMGIPHGSGAIVSTARDLARFANALFGGELLDSASLKKNYVLCRERLVSNDL